MRGRAYRTSPGRERMVVQPPKSAGRTASFPEQEERADHQAERRRSITAIDRVDCPVLGGPEEPHRRSERDQRVRRQQAHEERRRTASPTAFPPAPAAARKMTICVGRLGTDPVHHPDHERGPTAVVHERIVRLRVLVVMMTGATVMAVMPIRRPGCPRPPRPRCEPGWASAVVGSVPVHRLTIVRSCGRCLRSSGTRLRTPEKISIQRLRSTETPCPCRARRHEHEDPEQDRA